MGVTTHVVKGQMRDRLNASLYGRLHLKLGEGTQLKHGLTGGNSEVDDNVTLKSLGSHLSMADILDLLGRNTELLEHLMK